MSVLEFCFTHKEGGWLNEDQGLYSLSGKTSNRMISWSLEATKFGFGLFKSLWNLAGTCAAEMPVKFQSDAIIITPNLAASRLHEI